jgi:ferric-dicitrate binding protein FerR (iron transport regulator)
MSRRTSRRPRRRAPARVRILSWLKVLIARAEKPRRPASYWQRVVPWRSILTSLLSILATPHSPKLPEHPRPPDFIATDIGERKNVSLDGATLALNTQSRVSVSETAERLRIHVYYGEILCNIEHRPGRLVEILTDTARIIDIGTKFDLRVSDRAVTVTVVDGSLELATLSGSSRYTSTQASLILKGGQRAQIISDGPNLHPVAPVPSMSKGNVSSLQPGAKPHDAGSMDVTSPQSAGARVDTEPLHITSPQLVTETVDMDEINASLAWQQDELNIRPSTVAEIAREFNRYNRRPQIVIGDATLGAMRFSGVYDVHHPEIFIKDLRNINPHVAEIRHDGTDFTVVLILRR